jgi:hypothetical protein
MSTRAILRWITSSPYCERARAKISRSNQARPAAKLPVSLLESALLPRESAPPNDRHAAPEFFSAITAWHEHFRAANLSLIESR